jgi:hypothetical protein
MFKFLDPDPFVDSLSWPSTELDRRTSSLLNSLLIIKKMTRAPSDHTSLNIALQDLNHSLQRGTHSSGHLAKAINHTFTHPESNQTLRQLGNLFALVPTEEQQVIQEQLQSITSHGLSCFEQLSPEFEFKESQTQLFTQFIEKIEQIRSINSSGDTSQASSLLFALGSLFDGISVDGDLAQQETFNAFFSPNGLCKLFDHSALPCTFTSDLVKSEYLEQRKFVNACLAMRPLVSPDKCEALNQSLRLTANAINNPPMREEDSTCSSFIFDSVVNSGDRNPFNDKVLQALQSLAETGGNPQLISLRNDCLKILNAGIKNYGGSPEYPYNQELSTILSSISESLEQGKSRKYSDAIWPIFPHAKSLGVGLESSIPVELKIKSSWSKLSLPAKAAAPSTITGATAVYLWKNYKSSSAQKPDEEATARENGSDTKSRPRRAATGAPVPPDPNDPNNRRNNIQDQEPHKSDDETDGENEVDNGLEKIKLSSKRDILKHIFRSDAGHLQDTIVNRKLLLDLVKDAKNFAGQDSIGRRWYGKTLPNGKQLWAEVRKGIIRNGGINDSPKIFDELTGFKRNIIKV